MRTKPGPSPARSLTKRRRERRRRRSRRTIGVTTAMMTTPIALNPDRPLKTPSNGRRRLESP